MLSCMRFLISYSSQKTSSLRGASEEANQTIARDEVTEARSRIQTSIYGLPRGANNAPLAMTRVGLPGRMLQRWKWIAMPLSFSLIIIQSITLYLLSGNNENRARFAGGGFDLGSISTTDKGVLVFPRSCG